MMRATDAPPLHSDLPETVRSLDRSSLYKYSVPESPQPHSTVYALHTVDETLESPPASSKIEQSQFQHRRWSLLLLLGLILMTIAGVAGGFIGKTIERNSSKGTTSLESASASVPALSSSSASSASLATPTPSSTAERDASGVFERTIVQPSSGCSSADPYRSFKARSFMLNIPYTTVCGQGWLSYDLISMSVATQSDCIESCSQYNSIKETGDRSCVGAGFIPAWWNQTLAMVESGITPYNCFLKTNTSGIARNNQKFEVIAICMEGMCDNIVG
ncbi:uncharacterized protein M421DRAFT_417705 [Didymella exigua CBS 183.55]|uniref:Apple domain-containing protein n=1 Tax=Didymella exigua CBS 183.55 TaxID=1150837 RepID=A0A6A5RU28_9PLEO|nr:uncharacterized protein M421DRAFT_417705 [Didymella exigua CBS 183.55]KAF1931059.1 hypothetical protein M421DRAFT_417705 [Didymella exigua CBS 183.55]